MRVHPRVRQVNEAEAVINEALHNAWTGYDLTSIEVLQILTAKQQSILKYMLRTERHPENPDKGGDEA